MTEQSLKPGWKMWRFDQIAVNVNARIDNPSEAGAEFYVGLEHLDTDSLKIRRWGKPEDVEATKLCFKKGDIIFARRRAYQRKLGVAEFDGICSAHAMVLRPRTDVVLPEFLPFFMQSELFMRRAVEISVGSLSPTINWKTLAVQQFALPPLEEQLRISKLLAGLYEVFESLMTALSEIRMLKKSFAAHAFSSGLNGGSINFTTSHYRQAPNTWDIRPLGDIFNILDNKRIPLKDSDRNKRQGPYPYFGASGQIDSIDDYIFDEPILLIAEDGMNLIFRSSPLVYKVTEKCWVNNHAHVLRPTHVVDIDFYFEYLEAISYEPFVTGTYQKKITKLDCERIPLPVPPISEQKKIAASFSVINNRMMAILARQRAALNLFKINQESFMRASDV